MDDKTTARARKVLKANQKVLVVGVTPGNIGEWHQLGDPRLVFWDSRENHRRLPENVGLVVTTRFADHSQTDRIRASLPDSALFYPKPVSTGELKTFLRESYVPLTAPVSVSIQPAAKESEAMMATTAEKSDSVKFLEGFSGQMELASVAVREVATENANLRQQVQDLQKDVTERDRQIHELTCRLTESHDAVVKALEKFK